MFIGLDPALCWLCGMVIIITISAVLIAIIFLIIITTIGSCVDLLMCRIDIGIIIIVLLVVVTATMSCS